MPNSIVLKGHLTWIIPLLIIIFACSFTLYTIQPTIEFFEEKDREEKEKEEKENREKEKETLGIISEDDIDKIEKELEKLKKRLHNASNTKEDKEISKTSSNKAEIKENFVSFSNSERLRKNWRKKDIPKTLEKYNGPIQGYNCGEYNDYTSSLLQPTKINYNNYIKPPTGKSDYIFPGREQNNSGIVKHMSKPYILNYENDVNKKILEYESMNILPDYKPEDVSSLERPQYTYHRKDGTDDPIITDDNRFNYNNFNVFNDNN